MLRIIVYSLLFCLIILTLFFRYYQKPSGITKRSTESIQASAEIQSPQQQPSPEIRPSSDAPSPEIGLQTLSIREETDAGPGTNDLLSRANERFRSGDFERAAGLFKELADSDKRALPAVGMSLFSLGKYREAKEYFEMALESAPDDFVSRKALAFSYYKLDDLERSVMHAEKGLSLSPDPELQALFDRLRKESSTQRDFIEESTAHFKVLFDGYEHGKIDREVLRILDDAYRLVGREMNYFPRGSVTVILNTNSDFFDTTGAPHWSGGIYDGKIRIPVRGAEAQSDLLKKVLFHEYTHAVVHSITQKCPLWINEGLAEYFSAESNRKIGQVIPLRNLENSFSGLSDRDALIAYQESYSAVSYLIERYGMHSMIEMLESLSQGNDLDRAFRNGFSMTYLDFVREWGRQ